MTVTTVRDFSVVFDAYMQFEESMLAAKMEQLEEELDQDDADDDEDVRPPPPSPPASCREAPVRDPQQPPESSPRDRSQGPGEESGDPYYRFSLRQ
jgi:hypothetical protein